MISTELILNTVIEEAKKEKGIVSIKSRFGNEYDRPDTIILKGKKKSKITPDLVIAFKNRTDLYLVEQEADYNIVKWRLLALYALKMKGNLYIVAPKDYELHIAGKLKDSGINARMILF